MSNAIQPAGPAQAPALRYGFTSERVELVKRQVAKGATNDELDLFLYNCQRRGLDPLSRQIYFVKRGDKVSFQTAIDGFRLIADRTRLYAGSDDYRFDEGLNEYQHIQTERGKPVTATVTVYKMVQGQRVPFTATGRWDEYYPGDRGGMMWNKMPYLMLGKCVEALALRKAFPEELGGLYVKEEMEQANGPIEAEYREADAQPGQPDPDPVITREQLNALKIHAKHKGVPWGDVDAHARSDFDVDGIDELTISQGRELGHWINQEARRQKEEATDEPASDTTTNTTDAEYAVLDGFDDEGGR